MVAPKGVVGLDCSSKGIHAALLTLEGKLQALWCVKSARRDVDARFFELIDGFEGFVSNLSELYVGAVEKPIYIQNTLATLGVAQVVAGVKLTLQNNGLFFFNVGNTTWKKVIVGKGNASKEDIKRYAVDRWGLADNLEQDFFDSLCIAAWGVKQLRNEQELDSNIQ